MNLCDNGHEEVVYAGQACPCCELLKENGELKDNIIDVDMMCASLRKEVTRLKAEKK